MLSTKAVAQIVWVGNGVWGSRAASISSKAASRVAKKAAASAASGPASAAAAATETPKGPAKPATPKVKATPKLYPVSPALSRFLGGVAESSRTDTVKQVWVYIRDHDLQDPADRKQVNCDAKLKTVLGKDQVHFLEIAALLSPHFPKKEEKKS